MLLGGAVLVSWVMFANLVNGQDQDPPNYETEVENVLSRLQTRNNTDNQWTPNPYTTFPVGWFLARAPGHLTRLGWRLGDITDKNGSAFVANVNTSLPEPYEAVVVQNPKQPENGLPISTSWYSTVHATYPASSVDEIEEGEQKHDLFDGPFSAVPWSNKFFTIFSDGCVTASTLTTTVTDAAGTVTIWRDMLPTRFVQVQHDFPANVILPFKFEQTTEPFVGSINGTVRDAPFRIALGTGNNAPSLYSYYQIGSSFCGQQDDD